MSKKVAFYTLGCKLNQAESGSLKKGFEDRGYRIVNYKDEADIFVINTCTVTKRADSKCNKIINHITKNNPRSVIAVIGCYAQLNPLKIHENKQIDLILGSSEKFKIFDYLNFNHKNITPVIASSSPGSEFETEETLGYSTERTRAYLKIQDGCSSHCTYCIVPLARGKSRSRKKDKILEQAAEMVDDGFKEIVLTGVNIGDYEDGWGLPNLVMELLTINDLQRLRLSSIEPESLTDELIELVAGNNIICRHLHIPLQSGDDEILKRMGRKYTVKESTSLIEKIVEKAPYTGIGADFITGFPGEEERNFRNTYEFIQNLPFSHLHVFGFSKREGTPAAKMSGSLSRKIIRERSRILIDLGNRKKKEFLEKHIGLTGEVLFESMDESGYYTGFTENYIRVKCKGEKLCNEIRSVQLKSLQDTIIIGELVE